MIIYQDNNLMSYEEWLLKRYESIGASEVGAIVYGNKWTCNLDIFYQKVTGIKRDIRSLKTYRGHKHENIIDQFHPYYEGSDQSVFLNEEAKRYIKKTVNRNVTAKNTKWPHLTVTNDRYILPYGQYEGMGEGSCEYKSTSSWVLKSYEAGIVPDHLMQNITQINVNEHLYGEIFYFIDNNSCSLFELRRKDYKSNWQRILDVTTPFWESVIKARPIYNEIYEAKMNFQEAKAKKLETELAQLEPPLQNTEGYANFLTQRYKDRMQSGGLLPGTEQQLTYAKNHKKIDEKIKKLKVDQQKYQILLMSAIKDAKGIDFGKAGSVTWYQNAQRRTFSNKVTI